MSEIWENDELKEKLLMLSPALQSAFMQTVERLYNKESEVMLSFIEESRLDMQLTAEEIMREQEALRDTSNLFKGMKKDEKIRPPSSHDRQAVDNYLRQKAGAVEDSLTGNLDSLGLDLDFVTLDDDETEMMTKKKEKKKNKKKKRAQTNEDVTVLDITEIYQEETTEMLRGLSANARKQENERTRQAELLKEKKEQRRQKKQAVEEILEQVKGQEEMLTKTKDRQKQMLEERLEEKRRRKRAESRESSFVSTVSDDSGVTLGVRSPRGALREEVINIEEDIQYVQPKKTKKGKKHQEEIDVSDILEDVELPKKEKKKKNKTQEIVLDVNELEESQMKKKKKGKKKDVVDQDIAALDDLLNDLGDEAPKKKNKKKIRADMPEDPELESEDAKKVKKKKKKKQQDEDAIEDW